ncbi:MAG: 4'-phosphopantetheinyl transferase superfamily protein [Bacteroidota bacterium]
MARSFSHTHELHLWWTQDNAGRTLALEPTKAELERVTYFKSPQRTREYLFGHSWMRSILRQYLPQETETLELLTSAHGKPFLPNHHLSFNLSHSNGTYVLAVAAEGQLGLDVEWQKRAIEPDFLRSVFQPEELADTDHILHRWTLKEALRKALDDPTIPFREMRVDLHPLQVKVPNAILDHQHWSFRHHQLDPEYLVGLAWAKKAAFQAEIHIFPG